MATGDSPSLVIRPRVLRSVSALLGAGATGVGVLALLGWASGFWPLTTVLAGLTPMQVSSAMCVIALGLASCALAIWATRNVAVFTARVLSFSVLALALCTLAEYLFGRALGLDEALFRVTRVGGVPEWMDPNTAIAVALLATAILAITGVADVMILRAHIMTAGTCAIALFTLVGYAYSATHLYQLESTTPMAVNTSIALLLLCGSVYWSKPDRGLMATIHADDGAGITLRRLLPAAIAVPLVLGWIGLAGQRAGLYDATNGVALLVLATIAIFVALIALNSGGVKALEKTREQGRAELQSAYESVERRVVERTQELNETLARLADSERRYDLATEGSNSGVLDLDLATQIIHCSARWNEMLGRSVDEPLDVAAFRELVHPDDREASMQLLIDHFKGLTGLFSTEVRMLHKNGSYRWMLSRGKAMRDPNGRAIRMIGSQTDITELKALQEALRDASIRDGLTGLFNRTHFIERVTATTKLATRHNIPISFCMCDVDRFKQVNDTHGHQLGDEVIRAVGEAIATEIRASDIGARYGGDEFCILFAGAHAHQAQICVDRIKLRVEKTQFSGSDGRPFSVTMSFGMSDMGDRSIPELIEAGDNALYMAKRMGRSRVVVIDPELQARAQA
ncbi:MAG TPA: diguanylate cyclase [Candidatus Eremiobacteraceae bacterium]|nr:diguanylate cyclase [Candidatus Eremiobacteraceae bacterium]